MGTRIQEIWHKVHGPRIKGEKIEQLASPKLVIHKDTIIKVLFNPLTALVIKILLLPLENHTSYLNTTMQHLYSPLTKHNDGLISEHSSHKSYADEKKTYS